MGDEPSERVSMELGCVHWDRRDWGWGGSFRERPPTSMQSTFMLGFSPAAEGKKKALKHHHSIKQSQCRRAITLDC